MKAYLGCCGNQGQGRHSGALICSSFRSVPGVGGALQREGRVLVLGVAVGERGGGIFIWTRSTLVVWHNAPPYPSLPLASPSTQLNALIARSALSGLFRSASWEEREQAVIRW